VQRWIYAVINVIKIYQSSPLKTLYLNALIAIQKQINILKEKIPENWFHY